MTYLINDPVNINEIIKRKFYIDSITSFSPLPRDEAILHYMKGKSVLDIGFAEHNIVLAENKDWFHKKIVGIAKECIGVDLNKSLVDALNLSGYSSIVADVCSKDYLGQTFEVIHAGDIIEHLHNIEGFFGFLKRHLRPDGVVVISTPSPFSRHTLGQFVRYGIDVPNLEHVSWVTPFNMIELCRRFDMILLERVFPTKRSSGRMSFYFAMCSIFPVLKKYYEFSAGENIYILRHS